MLKKINFKPKAHLERSVSVAPSLWSVLRIWCNAKKFIKTASRCGDPIKVQEALLVYMWYKWHGETYPGGPFVRILEDIRHPFDV